MIKTSFCSLQSYFKDAWNTFDFITVVGSIVDALMVEFAVSVYMYLRANLSTETRTHAAL
jgi:hypothetical protein